MDEIEKSYCGNRKKEKIEMKTILSNVPYDTDDEFKEKPWEKIPCYFIFGLICYYIIIGYCTQLIEDNMQAVINNSEVFKSNPESFSEVSAKKYLEDILGGKPRVAGTSFHYKKTADLKKILDKIAEKAILNVKTDWQLVSGSYILNFGTPFINVYQNLSNVIALLEGESGVYSNGTIGSSILINCHYDSVPYAIGASDNGLFCAAMTECLNVLSKKQTKLKHNIIFLYNGAEENPLQGSHGFLKHPWSKSVTAVINLDSAGMNGKPMLFQATDKRVLDAYKMATRNPNAQSFGEVLFKTGLIPSDTDFRVWRDFGNISGIDIAFTKWGHVYHTRNDRPELIRSGVIQTAGDMLLRTITTLAEREDLDSKTEPKMYVYFDYLNLFMMCYTLETAFIVDLIILILSLITILQYLSIMGFRKTIFRELLYAAAGRITCALIGIIFATFWTLILYMTTTQLRYLSNPWLVIPMFWMPYFAGFILASHLYASWRSKKHSLNAVSCCIQAQTSTIMCLSTALIISMFFPSFTSASYLLSVPLLLMSVTAIISMAAIRRFNFSAWQLFSTELILSLPCLALTMVVALRITALILPILGRSTSSYADLIAGGLNIQLDLLVSMPLSGVELLFSRKNYLRIVTPLLSVCFLISLFYGEPYSDLALQRHYWFHSRMLTYDRNGTISRDSSGVFVMKTDANNIQTTTKAMAIGLPHLRYKSDFIDECNEYVYCNMPVFRVRFEDTLKNGILLLSGPPKPFEPPPELKLIDKLCQDTYCMMTFSMIGGPHNTLTLRSMGRANITQINIISPFNDAYTQIDKSQPFLVIFHSTATFSQQMAPLRFVVELNVPRGKSSDVQLEISHHAHKIHHPEDFTEEYKKILSVMPEYCNIASTITLRSNYVF